MASVPDRDWPRHGLAAGNTLVECDRLQCWRMFTPIPMPAACIGACAWARYSMGGWWPEPELLAADTRKSARFAAARCVAAITGAAGLPRTLRTLRFRGKSRTTLPRSAQRRGIESNCWRRQASRRPARRRLPRCYVFFGFSAPGLICGPCPSAWLPGREIRRVLDNLCPRRCRTRRGCWTGSGGLLKRQLRPGGARRPQCPR